MKGPYFTDYVQEFIASGVVAFDAAALIRHGDGEAELPRTFVTAMGQEPNRPSIAQKAAEHGRMGRPSLASLARDQELGAVFRIAKRPGNAFDHISVGRAANVDVVLPLLRISKFHAYFNCDASGQYTLSDAGSTNGTWIGAQLLPARTPEALDDGARIRLGPYYFTFATASGFERMVRNRALDRGR
ncbi:MAG: phosphopeptide-binding protein [Myxococcaceae bacterium]|nr:phosphopeptide-binding protein [Myxococcaceae bacterium]